MAKATTAIKQVLHYQDAHAAWFAANQVLFNQVAAFYFEVIQAHEHVLDLSADFVSILYSFCARLYGQRRAKRKTEKIVQDLNVKAEQKTPREVGEERAAS